MSRRSDPDDVTGYVSRYVARRVPSSTWLVIAEDVRRAVSAAATSLESAKTMCSHVAGYAAWLTGEGMPTGAESMSDLETIDRYVEVGMRGRPDGSRATRRAILRRVAERIDPFPRPRPEPLAYRFVRPPYESWQVTRFLDLALSQPTMARRRSALAVLALGLGAGLDGRDIGWIRGTDVIFGPDGATVVMVDGGSRPRRVVALDRYAELIRTCADAAGEQLLIGAGTPGGRNVTSVALARLIDDPDLPRLVASRLRSTWLLTHLAAGTPLHVLLPAAGLSTARPLEDLLPLVAAPPEHLVSDLLRGVA